MPMRGDQGDRRRGQDQRRQPDDRRRPQPVEFIVREPPNPCLHRSDASVKNPIGSGPPLRVLARAPIPAWGGASPVGYDSSRHALRVCPDMVFVAAGRRWRQPAPSLAPSSAKISRDIGVASPSAALRHPSSFGIEAAHAGRQASRRFARAFGPKTYDRDSPNDRLCSSSRTVRLDARTRSRWPTTCFGRACRAIPTYHDAGGHDQPRLRRRAHDHERLGTA